jgi:hypothetical protein
MTTSLPVRLRHFAYLMFTYLMSVLACPVGAVAEGVPAAIFGQYSGAGCSREPVRSDPVCVPAASSDLLHIWRGSDGSANVSVRMVFGQGNACQIDGVAESRDTELVLRTEGVNARTPCELVIRFKGNAATLEDAGSRCQPVYCGVRGVFTGARFVKRR